MIPTLGSVGYYTAEMMLCAYYDRSCDSRELFADLEIARDPSFEEHLNKYPVIYLDLTAFATRFKKPNLVNLIDAELKKDIHEVYPEKIQEYTGDILLVGISYDQDTKEHKCQIEMSEKVKSASHI